MLDFRKINTISIIGGGTAGWFAALKLKKLFDSNISVQLIESPEIGIVGVGEGGLINLIQALNNLNIPTSELISETGASFKWGFCYEGWRTGLKDDEYYHLFANPNVRPFSFNIDGFYPEICSVISQNIPLSNVTPAFSAIKNRVSQSEAAKILTNGDQGISSSLHFDSHKVAKFLAKKAKERGVSHIQTKVKDILFDEQGMAEKIVTENGIIDTNFIIDASGFSRLIIGNKLKSNWKSFKEYLLLNSAIPFHIPHQNNQPELVTRATAMNAGWMWQIPLVERIGAGYVFNSEFTSEEDAIKEVERYFDFKIEPQRTLKFEPGHFEEVWQKNVMALGLSSGFVEPLEATSIGQMLEQLRMFENVVMKSGFVVSDLSIAQFNKANESCWQGIRDFLRMHYDCPRIDTPFWKKVNETPYPESYKAIKEVFMQRCPRNEDIKGYAQHSWSGIFHVINWIYVAQALGLISADLCRDELALMKSLISQQQRLS